MLDIVIHKWLSIPYTLHVRTNRKPAKSRATVLFLHGIGNTGEAWDEVTKELPEDFHLITIDLLGFGQSQRPTWARYSAKTQARSVMATFLRLRIRQPVIIVGHSLGSLVAVEMAKRYPLVVRSLVLCSTPFYKVDETQRKLIPNSDRILKDMYRFTKKHPAQVLRMSALAIKYGLVNRSFNLTKDNLDIYLDALESTIVNQTSLGDAERINKPMTIIRGRFDPIVVPGNLKRLASKNNHVKLITIPAGHEIKGKSYVPAVTDAIISIASSVPKRLAK